MPEILTPPIHPQCRCTLGIASGKVQPTIPAGPIVPPVVPTRLSLRSIMQNARAGKYKDMRTFADDIGNALGSDYSNIEFYSAIADAQGANGFYYPVSKTIQIDSIASKYLEKAMRGERSIEAWQGLRTMIHELVHGTSPYMKYVNAHGKVGTNWLWFEEGLVERRARAFTTEMMFGKKNIPNWVGSASPSYYSNVGVMNWFEKTFGKEALEKIWLSTDRHSAMLAKTNTWMKDILTKRFGKKQAEYLIKVLDIPLTRLEGLERLSYQEIIALRVKPSKVSDLKLAWKEGQKELEYLQKNPGNLMPGDQPIYAKVKIQENLAKLLSDGNFTEDELHRLYRALGGISREGKLNVMTLVKDIPGFGDKNTIKFIEKFASPQEFLTNKIADNLVRRWAVTSGDEDVMAIAIQKAIQKEFGLATARNVGKLKPTIETANRIFGENEKILRFFVRGMYEETQKQLKEAGFKYVTLYRGMDDKTLGVLLPGGDIKYNLSEILLQPASSFSADGLEALSFAENLIMAIRVPIEKVLSTSRSGFGCLSEAEFVLLGGEIDASVAIGRMGNLISNLSKLFKSMGIEDWELTKK